jgi:3,4-dihydroxy-2-butanone 4-phosphate synthase
MSKFSDIESALEAFARGEMLVVMDDEDRENEGDLIMGTHRYTHKHKHIHTHIHT